MVVIVTTSPGFASRGPAQQLLEQQGWEFIRCTDATRPDGGLADHIGRADILVAGLPPVTDATLAPAGQLKAVLKHGAGLDSVDLAACAARGLVVTNTPGANSNAVAELAIGLMFTLARGIARSHVAVTTGGWDRRAGVEISGKTVGVVGLGAIGKLVARKAVALGAKVVATDLYPDQNFVSELGIEIADLDDLLSRSDFVSLHVHGGASNAAMIDRKRLAGMKAGACLLNLARGDVIDIDAVTEALEQGRLGGVAIDAFSIEPPDISHPIFRHPNAVFTPHSGADTQESFDNMGRMVIEDILDVLAGKTPKRAIGGQTTAGRPS